MSKEKFWKWAIPDEIDERDLPFEIPMGAAPFDWETWYDVEKEIGFKIPFKDQNWSSSCVWQGWAYYVAVLNAFETGGYDDVSAKAIYSQIFLDQWWAYIRNGWKLIVDWWAVKEEIVSSYMNGNAPTEEFMRKLDWRLEHIDKIAKNFQAKEYRVINWIDMETIACAIRDNKWVVWGVWGCNNGTWSTNEPWPRDRVWWHCIFFWKAGTDEKWKYISTPNSWWTRNQIDSLHQDDWQKLREDYFTNEFMFNPWVIVDKPNTSDETLKIMGENEKKIIIEWEGHWRKWVIVDWKLQEIKEWRESDAALYVLTNNGFGTTVTSAVFDEIPKDKDF